MPLELVDDAAIQDGSWFADNLALIQLAANFAGNLGGSVTGNGVEDAIKGIGFQYSI